MALKHWLWLSSRRGLGNSVRLSLLERFDTPEQVYFADKKTLETVEDLTEQGLASLMDKDVSEAREILESCQDRGIKTITLGDAVYPGRLRNIYDPPLVLYVAGDLPDIDDEAAIAIVGTRKCTPYGVKTAERFGYEIAAAGGLVISGLARGIDTAGARGALRAGGRVLGVLGTAIDVVYPAENRDIYRRVTERGALISEYPPGAITQRSNFPMRNRIMSGLAVGVTVIEAPEGSGALITAARALEQGRDVFAVPGNVDAPSCAGSNSLLKEGAEAVTSGLEIIAGYLPRFPDKLKNITGLSYKEASSPGSEIPESRELLVADVKAPTIKKEIDKRESADYIDIAARRRGLSENEGKVFDALTSPEMQVDEITAACGLKAGEVLSALTLLEIKGFVKQSAGKRFTLIK